MLCEDNFQRLLKLTPDLHSKTQQSGVYIRLYEQTPYTYTLFLQTTGDKTKHNKRGFKCRVYLDTESVDVLSIEGENNVRQIHHACPRVILNNKWMLNQLFEKWLNFQLLQPTANYQPINKLSNA